jgi:hypothetical protein
MVGMTLQVDNDLESRMVCIFSPASTLNGLDPTSSILQDMKQTKTRNVKPKALKKKAPMHVPDSDLEIRGQPKVDIDVSIKWTHDPQWAAAFIPSLTQALYTSHKPFEDFKRDSAAFLDTVQEVFDASFPHIEYTLRSSDALVREVWPHFYLLHT